MQNAEKVVFFILTSSFLPSYSSQLFLSFFGYFKFRGTDVFDFNGGGAFDFPFLAIDFPLARGFGLVLRQQAVLQPELHRALGIGRRATAPPESSQKSLGALFGQIAAV